MSKAYVFGKKAEDLAAAYLIKSGYSLLERNYRYLKAEVDLIVQKEDLLVAVEVKARSDGFMVALHESITPKKIKLLVSAIDHYVQTSALDVSVRFDIITFIYKNGNWHKNHIENAFYSFG